MKNKIFVVLLLAIFVLTAGFAVAADDAGATQDLKTSDENAVMINSKDVSLQTGDEDALAADSKDVSLPTSNENGAFDPDEDDKASLVIDVSTPKKTYKVGDIVNINVKIKNEGDVIAKGVLASISFSGDGFKIPSTLKFIDDKNDKVYVSDSGKVYIRPGNIAEEDTYSTTLRFIVKTIGDLTIIGYVDGINNYGANKVNTTIKIVAVHKDKKTGKKVGKKNMTHESSKNESSQANESSKTYDSSKTSTSAENKELLATGNPIALLGLVVILLSCIPYRRD